MDVASDQLDEYETRNIVPIIYGLSFQYVEHTTTRLEPLSEDIWLTICLEYLRRSDKLMLRQTCRAFLYIVSKASKLMRHTVWEAEAIVRFSWEQYPLYRNWPSLRVYELVVEGTFPYIISDDDQSNPSSDVDMTEESRDVNLIEDTKIPTGQLYEADWSSIENVDRGIIENLVPKLTTLTTLIVNRYNIITCETIKSLPTSLTSLHLDQCVITGEALGCASDKVRNITIQNTGNLATFPKGLRELRLYECENMLTCSHALPESLTKLTIQERSNGVCKDLYFDVSFPSRLLQLDLISYTPDEISNNTLSNIPVSLTSLSLFETTVGDMSCLYHLTNLTSFDACGSDIDEGSTITCLRSWKRLTRLKLIACKNLSDNVIRFIPTKLVQFGGFTSITDDGLKKLPTTLIALYLTGCKYLSDNGIQGMGVTHTNLRKLVMRNMKNITTLKNFPTSLTEINVSNGRKNGLVSLDGIPPKLNRLMLFGPHSDLVDASFRNIPTTLQTIYISGCLKVTREFIKHLPCGLTRMLFNPSSKNGPVHSSHLFHLTSLKTLMIGSLDMDSESIGYLFKHRINLVIDTFPQRENDTTPETGLV